MPEDFPAIRVIAGLGNPGREYEQTRHNAGFMIADRVAAGLGAAFANEKKFEAMVARSGSLFLVKPQTFMNLSGRAVAAVCQFYKIEPCEVLAVYDDAALARGRLRLRPGGSAGGHNGMRSLIACLGTEAIPRLRFGVGGSEQGALIGHVLSRFERDDGALNNSLEKAAEAATMAALRGLAAAMNQFNKDDTPPA